MGRIGLGSDLAFLQSFYLGLRLDAVRFGSGLSNESCRCRLAPPNHTAGKLRVVRDRLGLVRVRLVRACAAAYPSEHASAGKSNRGAPNGGPEHAWKPDVRECSKVWEPVNAHEEGAKAFL